MSPSKHADDETVFRVLPRQVGQTVAAALRQWMPDRSWSQVRALLKARRVMLSGNLCTDVDARLRLVDVVKILPHPIAAPPQETDVRIRYLDRHIVVVEKPSGITSTRYSDEQDPAPRRRQLQPTLDELLPRVIQNNLKSAKGSKNAKGVQKTKSVRAVHRLDRETSGLMVFARTAEAEKNLGQQFRVHSITRRYLAIAHGRVPAQTIESRLVRDRGDGRRGSTRLPNAGRLAVTHVQPLESLGDYTLVECRLETGRTHQIRIHLAENGHPLCGERVYNQPLFRPSRPDRSGAPRLALCAVELGFLHPVTGQPMHFDMPLSPDLAAFVRRLRKQAKSSGCKG
ncbi:MAG: RluA family pseudouridine synthase [Planctomycetaceae bacterium]|nr:RluA family pseudouridine synthase [Planctomycetaceae bacterium]